MCMHTDGLIPRISEIDHVMAVLCALNTLSNLSSSAALNEAEIIIGYVLESPKNA